MRHSPSSSRCFPPSSVAVAIHALVALSPSFPAPFGTIQFAHACISAVGSGYCSKFGPPANQCCPPLTCQTFLGCYPTPRQLNHPCQPIGALGGITTTTNGVASCSGDGCCAAGLECTAPGLGPANTGKCRPIGDANKGVTVIKVTPMPQPLLATDAPTDMTDAPTDMAEEDEGDEGEGTDIPTSGPASLAPTSSSSGSPTSVAPLAAPPNNETSPTAAPVGIVAEASVPTVDIDQPSPSSSSSAPMPAPTASFTEATTTSPVAVDASTEDDANAESDADAPVPSTSTPTQSPSTSPPTLSIRPVCAVQAQGRGGCGVWPSLCTGLCQYTAGTNSDGNNICTVTQQQLVGGDSGGGEGGARGCGCGANGGDVEDMCRCTVNGLEYRIGTMCFDAGADGGAEDNSEDGGDGMGGTSTDGGTTAIDPTAAPVGIVEMTPVPTTAAPISAPTSAPAVATAAPVIATSTTAPVSASADDAPTSSPVVATTSDDPTNMPISDPVPPTAAPASATVSATDGPTKSPIMETATTTTNPTFSIRSVCADQATGKSSCLMWRSIFCKGNCNFVETRNENEAGVRYNVCTVTQPSDIGPAGCGCGGSFDSNGDNSASGGIDDPDDMCTCTVNGLQSKIGTICDEERDGGGGRRKRVRKQLRG